MNGKVFVVETGDYEDRYVVGVAASMDAAMGLARADYERNRDASDPSEWETELLAGGSEAIVRSPWREYELLGKRERMRYEYHIQAFEVVGS